MKVSTNHVPSHAKSDAGAQANTRRDDGAVCEADDGRVAKFGDGTGERADKRVR